MGGLALQIVDPPPPMWQGERLPGMMWRWPYGDTEGRQCWCIVLPNLLDKSEITWRTTDHAHSEPHQLWGVTGSPPLITVTPSIDVEHWTLRNGESVRDGSYWHGHIINGELVNA